MKPNIYFNNIPCIRIIDRDPFTLYYSIKNSNFRIKTICYKFTCQPSFDAVYLLSVFRQVIPKDHNETPNFTMRNPSQMRDEASISPQNDNE